MKLRLAVAALVCLFSCVSFADVSGSSNQIKMGNLSYIVGGVLGTYPGFGLGHAVQGRWEQRGYIFTAGELGSLVVFAVGASEASGCALNDTINGSTSNCGNSAMLVGALGYLGFRIWEIVDVWLTPVTDNMIVSDSAKKDRAESGHRFDFAFTPPVGKAPANLAVAMSF